MQELERIPIEEATESIESKEEFIRLLAATTNKVIVRIGERNFHLSSDLLSQLVAASNSGQASKSDDLNNIYFSS